MLGLVVSDVCSGGESDFSEGYLVDRGVDCSTDLALRCVVPGLSLVEGSLEVIVRVF